MTTNLHSREKDKRSKAPHIPVTSAGRTSWPTLKRRRTGTARQTVWYANSTATADRLVCKLDRDLADSLDDCDIRGRCRSDLVNAIVRSFFENHLFRLAQYRREKKSLFNNYNPESHA